MTAGFEHLPPIPRGADYDHRLIWQDAQGIPFDLAGYAAKMQIRASAAEDEVLLELSTENGRITLGGSAGTIDLHLAASDTAACLWKRGYYDLWLIHGSAITRLVQGRILVSPGVTRT